MRRLVEHQAVTIEVELDADAWCIDCTVGNVTTPVATLAPIHEISPQTRESLRSGALGFMMFEWRGSTIALRGGARAIYGGAALEFVVLDGIHEKERRAAPRARLQTPVRARHVISGRASAFSVETVTVNLSLSGALLIRRPGLGPGPREIELLLPDHGAPVRCGAALARQTRDQIAVVFSEIREADLVRLAGTIADNEQLSWP
ncbi:MAG: PilZ domain-containing protein [Solirubrobacteraceae bacterium]